MIALLFAAALFGQGETAAAPTVAPVEAKPKLICRSEVPTGSVMPKKVCYTEQQLAAREQGARKDRDKLRDLRNSRPNL